MVFTLFSIAAVAAFPGAQGGGALSKGGRGGRVYLIANLNDSGPGSLRACVAASGPRTCVFRTGGTIALLSTLRADNPFLTIAGQTAPGGGIQLRGRKSAGDPALMITTHDVVVQYLRVRRGHYQGEICNAKPWSCGASIEIFSNSASTDPHEIMIDHVSAEWSNYDAMIALGSNAAPRQPRSLTVSHSIVGEALAGAGQTVGVNFGGYSGAGPAAPDGMTDLDFHHDLFPGTSHRMPLLTVKSARLVNNLVYAWTYYPMLGDVGASRELDCKGTWVGALDPLGRRIVKAVADGTTLHGSYDSSSLRGSPQSQADLGGWPTLAAGTPCADAGGNGLPDAWESHWARVFGHRIEPSGVDFADGYTNLEHYIDGMSPSP